MATTNSRKEKSVEPDDEFECSDCGQKVQRGDAFCLGCGAPLEWFNGVEEEIEYECPECGSKPTQGVAACPKCRTELEWVDYGKSDGEPSVKRCPSCGRKIRYKQMICFSCGERLREPEALISKDTLTPSSVIGSGWRTFSASKAILSLIVVDAITKVFAYIATDEYLLNPNGVMLGSDFDRVYGADHLRAIIISFSLLGSVLTYLGLKKTHLRRYAKMLLGSLAFPTIFIFATLIIMLSGFPQPNQAFSIFMLRGTASAIMFLFFRMAKSRYFRTVFGLIFCGALGNTLSLLYPPFKVVDFLHFLKLVMNFADLYFFFGLLMLIAAPFFLALSKEPKTEKKVH